MWINAGQAIVNCPPSFMKKKICIIAMLFLMGVLLTTCRVPDFYGRWSLETFKSRCLLEIVISKEPYRSLIFIEERDKATFYSYDSDRRVQDFLTYDLDQSNGDLYEFTPFKHVLLQVFFVIPYFLADARKNLKQLLLQCNLRYSQIINTWTGLIHR
jgi:hypothetical protein